MSEGKTLLEKLARLPTDMGVGQNEKPPGDRRPWSMFPSGFLFGYSLTRSHMKN